MNRAVVVMGVSGSGKSTLGRRLAGALDLPFVEGDDLHPAANVAKMAAGIPLTDSDRLPFLERVGRAILERPDGCVVACSALKRRYRDLIREMAGGVVFVLPLIDRERLQARLAHRSGHFMPGSLLDSQLAALELPGEDEHAIVIDGGADTAVQVADVFQALESDAGRPP